MRFDEAKARLPAAVQERVIGGTWNSFMDLEQFRTMTRYEQIAADAQRRRVTDWIALDDNDMGWPDEERHRLVLCDPQLGLSAPGVIDELIERLHATSKP